MQYRESYRVSYANEVQRREADREEAKRDAQNWRRRTHVRLSYAKLYDAFTFYRASLHGSSTKVLQLHTCKRWHYQQRKRMSRVHSCEICQVRLDPTRQISQSMQCNILLNALTSTLFFLLFATIRDSYSYVNSENDFKIAYYIQVLNFSFFFNFKQLKETLFIICNDRVLFFDYYYLYFDASNIIRSFTYFVFYLF